MAEIRLLSRKEACKYVGLGMALGVKFCNESGARIEAGGRVLYDKYRLDKYIDSLINDTSGGEIKENA